MVKPSKICPLCGELKESRFFAKGTGLRVCLECTQNPPAETVCRVCKVLKPAGDFYLKYRKCKACKSAQSKAYGNTPSGQRARASSYLKHNYGITLDEFEQRLAEQGAVCAICGSIEVSEGRSRLSVDHCHATGKVRGLLCSPCNKGLGSFRDKPELLRIAATYLEKTRV